MRDLKHRARPDWRLSAACHWQWTAAAILVAAVPLLSQAGRPPVTAPPADSIIAAAVKQAGAQGKSVFVDFGASWCAPCRLFDAMFSAPALRQVWATHFIVVRLTVWEHGNEALNNPGAELFMEKWGGGRGRGIPYYAVLDRRGELVEAASGYPGGMADIAPFLARVTKAAPALSAAERRTLTDYLVANSNGLGSLAGRVADERGQPVAGAVVSIASRSWVHGAWRPVSSRRATTDAAGRYAINDVSAGSYPVIVTAPPPARGATRAPEFAPTFFPSASRLSEARPVPVARGQGVVNVDVTTSRAVPGSLAGVVRTSWGRPAAAAAVVLTSVEWPASTIAATAATDGTFNLRDAWPGLYTLTARTAPAGPSAPRISEVGVQQVDVPLSSTPPLTIVTAPLPSLSGRVHFDGASTMTPSERRAVRVAIVPVDVPAGVQVTTTRTAVGDAGEFRVTAAHARGVVRVEGLPAGWWLQSVTHGGRDVTDEGFGSVRGGDIDAIEVRLADRAPVLAGTVVNAVRRAASGGAAIVFAAAPERWTYPSRFVRSAPVQSDGTFRVSGLPPGEYLVARVATLEAAWDAPESLLAARATATAVRLVAGERKSVTLTVSPGPP
jgi:thiol-disulfide isomerase/thioredoxin